MSGYGNTPYGRSSFGGAAISGLPRGRVYATVTPAAGGAALASSRAGKAALAPSPQGFVTLSPSAGSSTLQND